METSARLSITERSSMTHTHQPTHSHARLARTRTALHDPTCSQGHTSQMTAVDTVRLSLRDVGFTWMTPFRSFSGRLQTCCPPTYSRALTCMWNLP